MSEQFHQKNRRLMQWILILALLDILMIGVTFYVETHISDPPYYQIWRQTNGKLGGAKMVPLGAPLMTQQAILQWSSNAASAIYTYDQAHYKQQIQAVIDTYFTKDGGESFKEALDQTGVLTQLVQQKLEVTAVVQGPPAILKSGILLGKQVWKIQMPLLVTYITASDKQEYSFLVTMMVVRVPTWQSSVGIGIDQLWVKKTN